MRADKYLSIDGLRESVMVGADNKLPALDASMLTHVDEAVDGTVPLIVDTMPASFVEADLNKSFLYVGDEVEYDKYAFYVVQFVTGSYVPVKISADADIVGLPAVTVSDNDKVLAVVAGVWDKASAPVSATTANVQSALSIDTADGLETKVLSEKGTFVDLPVVGDALPAVTTADNDKVLTVVSGVWDKATAPVSATTANVQSALSIDTDDGLETKVLSEKGTFVDMSGGGGLTQEQIVGLILALS